MDIIESSPRFLTNYPESQTSLSHSPTWSDDVNNVAIRLSPLWSGPLQFHLPLLHFTPPPLWLCSYSTLARVSAPKVDQSTGWFAFPAANSLRLQIDIDI